MTVRELIDKLILLVEDGCGDAPVVLWDDLDPHSLAVRPVQGPTGIGSKEAKLVVIE
jgi:hypothetical protein